jgi:hypothetical protein
MRRVPGTAEGMGHWVGAETVPTQSDAGLDQRKRDDGNG